MSDHAGLGKSQRHTSFPTLVLLQRHTIAGAQEAQLHVEPQEVRRWQADTRGGALLVKELRDAYATQRYVLWHLHLEFAFNLLIVAGCNLFREFLKGEFSEENIDFWLSVMEFKSSNTEQEIAERAQHIYHEFVAVQSRKEVCLLKLSSKHTNDSTVGEPRQRYAHGDRRTIVQSALGHVRCCSLQDQSSNGEGQLSALSQARSLSRYARRMQEVVAPSSNKHQNSQSKPVRFTLS